MKQILIFIAISLIAFTCHCQQFELLYDHYGFSNDGGAISRVDSGFFTTHLASYPILGFTTLIAYFDDQGILLWDTSLTSSTEEFSQSNWNTNILDTQNEQEKWVIGNYASQGENGNLPFLQKFNVNGTAMELIILDTLATQSPYTYGGIVNDLGIFIMCRNSANNKLMIIHCNSEGEYLEHYEYDTDLLFHAQCIVDVGDGFIVGGWNYANQTDANNNDAQQYIRKFSYDGESQWTNTLAYGDNGNYGAVGIVALDNGNYLFGGTKLIDNISTQPLIGELDATTGDTLWTKLFFDGEVEYDPNNLSTFNSINRLHGFKKLADGGFLGVGECRHDIIPDSAFGPLDNAALMMKLDSEYNLLWKRIFVPEGYAELDASPAQCQLNDFVENEDGSITALGRVYMYTGSGPQGGYIQDSYIIRVDSFGCLIDGCEVGMVEHETNQLLSVYPNPTAKAVTIEFPYFDDWRAAIFNANGQLVYQTQIENKIKTTIDLQGLPSGFYMLRCFSGHQADFTHAIIKQ